MYNSEKTAKDRKSRHEKQNPSFSSTLLDKIYSSIDEAEPKGDDFKFRRDTPATKKQSKSWTAEEEHILSLRQACLLDKWVEQNAKEKISLRHSHHFWSELDKKSTILDHDYDRHDALFFSSGSNSSESSSGGLSSSDTESFYNPKPSKSCFSRLKPIRVGSEKPDRRSTTLFYEQRELHVIDDYRFNSTTDQETQKSKSRFLKMYGNLKQPISPGGKLSSFLNSIFAGNGKKSKTPTFTGDLRKQRVSKSIQPSTCSSASSFSRSCLSKNSPASREKLRKEDKRSVRFCPVNLIADERKMNLEKEELKPMSVSVPAIQKSRRVEEAARDFLTQYHQKQSQPSACDRYEENKHQDDDDDDDDDDDEDDDDVSCTSSDLFELDHLAVIGDRYREELPVYETTRVDRNRAISNCISNPK